MQKMKKIRLLGSSPRIPLRTERRTDTQGGSETPEKRECVANVFRKVCVNIKVNPLMVSEI